MLPFEEFMRSLRFVVLSPEPNIARLRDTARSVRNNLGEVEMLCSVAKSVKKAQLDEMKEVCESFRGGDTVMSLINAGLKKKSEPRWNVLVMEGARIPRGMESRYRRWIEDERDVLFPIFMSHDLDGRPNIVLSSFEESTLNGMMIHSSLFKEVGPFSDNPIGISKRFWGLDAGERGAKFKAILGVKII
jgi:hypothetical protein